MDPPPPRDVKRPAPLLVDERERTERLSPPSPRDAHALVPLRVHGGPLKLSTPPRAGGLVEDALLAAQSPRWQPPRTVLGATPPSSGRADDIPVCFRWVGGAAESPPESVQVAGDWSNWQRIQLHQLPPSASGRRVYEITCSVPRSRAPHFYKFVVDGVWRARMPPPCRPADAPASDARRLRMRALRARRGRTYDPSKPTANDDLNNVNNVLDAPLLLSRFAADPDAPPPVISFGSFSSALPPGDERPGSGAGSESAFALGAGSSMALGSSPAASSLTVALRRQSHGAGLHADSSAAAAALTPRERHRQQRRRRRPQPSDDDGSDSTAMLISCTSDAEEDAARARAVACMFASTAAAQADASRRRPGDADRAGGAAPRRGGRRRGRRGEPRPHALLPPRAHRLRRRP